MTIKERFAKYTTEELIQAAKDLEASIKESKNSMKMFEASGNIELFKIAEFNVKYNYNVLIDVQAALVANEEITEMAWFDDVFLPSLEERVMKSDKAVWLTKKQVSVCKRYMDYNQYVRGVYEYYIGDKGYHVQVASNGCGHFFVTNKRGN